MGGALSLPGGAGGVTLGPPFLRMGICVASWLTTMSAGLHMRLVWCTSRLHLWASESFASTIPAQHRPAESAPLAK